MNPALQGPLKSNQHSCLRKKHGLTVLIFKFAIVLSSRGCSITPSQPCQDGHGRSFQFHESFYVLPKRNTRIDTLNFLTQKQHGYTVQVQPLPDGGQIDQNLTELLHWFASLCLAHYLPKIWCFRVILQVIFRRSPQ